MDSADKPTSANVSMGGMAVLPIVLFDNVQMVQHGQIDLMLKIRLIK
jgi:hypothetical protein